jgi:hypothetical protein
MKKLIAISLFAFASGCVTSNGVQYRTCNDLGTDMSVSDNEYYGQCPMRERGT